MADPSHLHKHSISFKHAFDGLWYTLQSQPNFRIHLSLTLIITALGFIVHLSRLEWLVIVFTIMWVLTAEMVNTAVESMVNLITTEHRQNAKIAKDVAAGMVLVGALGSIIVGLVIFIPYLQKIISN